MRQATLWFFYFGSDGTAATVHSTLELRAAAAGFESEAISDPFDPTVISSANFPLSPLAVILARGSASLKRTRLAPVQARIAVTGAAAGFESEAVSRAPVVGEAALAAAPAGCQLDAALDLRRLHEEALICAMASR